MTIHIEFTSETLGILKRKDIPHSVSSAPPGSPQTILLTDVTYCPRKSKKGDLIRGNEQLPTQVGRAVPHIAKLDKY